MKLASNIELIMASSMSSGMSAAQAILNQSVLWVVPPNRWLAIAQTVNCRNESRRESFLNSLGAAMISMSPRQWHVLHVSEKDILRDKFFFAFFPERRFVAGFFRRLLAYLTPHISHTYLTPHISHTYLTPHISHTYLTPHISHTYPSHHTYPTHIHSKRIPPIRIPPIRIRSTRIPPVRIHAMWSFQNVCNTYPTNTYPFNTYPTNTYPCYAYPFNAYPFKRCASAGIANVSHQYISHQYVSSTRIPPVRIHSMRIHSKSLHQQEWQWVWVSLHIISYHCYSAGMVMNIKTLLFLQFFAKLLIEYNCIARVWTWNSLLAIGLPACLPVVCFCACFLIIFYYSIPPGGMGRVNRKATLSLKTRRRSPKTVAKRKFHFLAVNPLATNVVSIAQNCSETQISFSRGQPSRYKRGVDRPKL